MSLAVFSSNLPVVPRKPIIVSVPHAGTKIPAEVYQTMRSELRDSLPDTDWFVPELYNFCDSLGIPMIHAQLSRYVVDLNRPKEGAALYSDSRRQTDAIPLTSFDGAEIYEVGNRPDSLEKQRRFAHYYQVYYAEIERLIQEAKKFSKHVLLFDAHSIRRSVPSLAPNPFADMIVGDRDGTSADPTLSHALLKVLRNTPYNIQHNDPFKGGQLTRFFGNTKDGVHALQLEMSQDIYMDVHSNTLDSGKALQVQSVLKAALTELASTLEKLQ